MRNNLGPLSWKALKAIVSGDEPPKGTLIDYFFGIANAQKVKMKPSAILFPLFALLLVAIHIAEPYLDLKSLLQFDM